MAVQIQIRRGNASEWTTADPVLMEGELGFEKDTDQWKIGNGTDTWSSLSYAVGVPEHDWNGTQIRFQNADGTWGDYVDLKGLPGNDGEVAYATPAEVVNVGSGEAHTTIGSALEYLSKKYPYYDETTGIRAIIRLSDTFAMQEQVLIDGQDLGWIRIEADTNAAQPIESFAIGSVILNSAVPEISRIKVDYNVVSTTTYFNTEFMNGNYIILETGGGDRHYYWFNANSGGSDPAISGTGHEVIVGLEDSATAMMTTLTSIVDNTTGFSASLVGRVMTVENAATGNVSWFSTLDELAMTITQVGQTDEHNHSFSVTSSEDQSHTHGVTSATVMSSSSGLHTHTGTGVTSTADGHNHDFTYTTSEADGSVPHTHTVSGTTEEDGTTPHTHTFDATTSENQSGTAQVQIATFEMEDYEVKAAETTYTESATDLNGSYVTLQTAAGADHYFWFDVAAGGSDPALSGTGHVIVLLEDDPATIATADLNDAIDLVAGFNSLITTGVIYVTNDANGPVDSVGKGGTNVYVSTLQSGSDVMYTTRVAITAHGFTNGDRIVIRDHAGDVEEVDYNGVWYVANSTTNNFELAGSVYSSGRAGAVLSGEVIQPSPVVISRAHLTERWEFFYYPAFGVARGTLPLIACEFEMDTSGSNAYMSYKDGFCATDQGKMNFMPFCGCSGAGGSNIYGTRASIINANDAIANNAGRHGIWGYSNTIINARRAQANDCGWAADANSVSHIDGFDEWGQSIGSGILAERGALINAEGCVVKDCYGDNIQAAFGGIISLGGHGADIVLEGLEVGTGLDYTSTGSIYGKNINTVAGMMFDREGTILSIKRYNEVVNSVIWDQTTHTIDLMLGNVHEVTLDGNNVEITAILNVLNRTHSFTLVVTQDVGVSRSLTYPASIVWSYGVIPDISGLGETYVLTFVTTDGGSTWLGFFVGGNFSGGVE